MKEKSDRPTIEILRDYVLRQCGPIKPSDDLADFALLRHYTERGSDDAFALLVNRHMNLVYSAALRRVRDPHVAEEVTQATFIILAKKAHQLNESIILSAWLYRTAMFACADALKMKQRRVRYEHEAAQGETVAGEDAWEHLAPLLDAALGQLGAQDRAAIILRFFEGRSLKEVGRALGSSEDSAQKRVARALERLRTLLGRREAILSSAALAALLSDHAVQAAPPGLASTAVTAASAGASAWTATTGAMVKGTLRAIAWAKIGPILGGCAVVVAAIVIGALFGAQRLPVAGAGAMQPLAAAPSPPASAAGAATNATGQAASQTPQPAPQNPPASSGLSTINSR